MKKYFNRAAVALTLMAASAISASAQNFNAESSLQQVAQTAKQYGAYVVNIAFVAVGLILAIQIVPGIIKANKGEGSAKDVLSGIGISGVVAFVILGVISAVFAFI